MRKVTTTIWIMKAAQTGLSVKSNISVVMKVEMMTIPTLMKLLLIRIVASRRSGLASNFSTRRDALVCMCDSLLRCPGFREKKATSEPDITAEPMSRITMTTIPVMIPGVIGFKWMINSERIPGKFASESKRKSG